jgi:RNA polymerase sigma-70 factor (ECF subfamily)
MASEHTDSVTRQLEVLRGGQESQAGKLLAGYEPWLRFLARLQIESRFQAKFDVSDVVQQAMVEAARDLPKFRGATGAELGAWLRRILAHVLAHQVRRYGGTLKRDVGREVSMEEELTHASERLGDMLPSPATGPEEALVRQERSVQLAAALERLPEDYRQVIVLRHLEGLSHDDVARRMGRNPGAVRMLWVRALARLRREVAAPWEESKI